MLSNAYFLAKFRFDTAENEPAKKLQNFVKFANFADPNPLTLTLVPSAARHPRREHAPGEAVRVAQHEVAAGAPDEQQDRRDGGGEGRLGRVVSFWQNFGTFSLVFGCIKTNFTSKYAFDSIFQNLPDYL